MPDKGYTVSPVITVNDRGEEVISDLSVSSGHSNDIGRDGQVRGVQNDYYEDEQGQIRHRFSDVELESERNSPSSFDEDAYIEAVFESNPQLSDAQQWAENNLPEEWLDDYNKAIDKGDLSELHQAVEWLLQQYENGSQQESQSPEPEPVEEDDEMEDLSDEEKVVLAEAVEQLENQEPEGEDVSDQWQEMVDQAEESGDATYATVAAATAAFHAGEVSAEEAINYCLNNCDLKDLARVYEHLNG